MDCCVKVRYYTTISHLLKKIKIMVSWNKIIIILKEIIDLFGPSRHLWQLQVALPLYSGVYGGQLKITLSVPLRLISILVTNKNNYLLCSVLKSVTALLYKINTNRIYIW